MGESYDFREEFLRTGFIGQNLIRKKEAVFVKGRSTGRLAVSLPFLCVTVLLPMVTGQRWLMLFALAAVLHEGGHLLALHLMGGRVERLCLRLSGGEIRYRDDLTYRQDAWLALAGPGANLLCTLACAGLARLCPRAELYRLIGCNLTLALFNLLPALPLDGGRVLLALLESRFPLWGETITKSISLLVGVLLLVSGLFLLKNGGNPTLLAAGSVIVLASDVKKALHLPKNLLK